MQESCNWAWVFASTFLDHDNKMLSFWRFAGLRKSFAKAKVSWSIRVWCWLHVGHPTICAVLGKKILSMPFGCLCYVLRIMMVTGFGAGKESFDQLMHLTRSAPCHCKGLGLSPNWGQAFGKTLPPMCSSVRRDIPPLLCNPHVHARKISLLWGSFWSTVCMKIC